MKNSEFLVKLKLVRKLNTAAKQRADKDLSGRKPTEASLTYAVNKIRLEFIKEAKSYISYLCTSVQNHVSSTTDLVRGMACFDPHMLFFTPLAQAAASFTCLYRSFSLRGWVAEADEAATYDEYMALIEALRAAYPQQDPDSIVDVVDFLSIEDSLQTRDKLLRLFRLSCLCLTPTTPELPDVKFGPVDTGNFHSVLVDLVRSTRSYIVNVPGSCQYVTIPDALRRFSSFGSALSDCILHSEYDH